LNAGASPREAVEQNNAQLFDDIGRVAGGDMEDGNGRWYVAHGSVSCGHIDYVGMRWWAT
jgi:hypothetical protein